MSISEDESIRIFLSFMPGDLTHWQSFLFCLWTLGFFIRRFSCEAFQLVVRWLLESLGDDEDQFTKSASSGESSTSGQSGVVHDGQSSLGLGETSALEVSLVPPVPDVVVRESVWPALMNPSSVQLLLLLCNVNGPWSRFVVTTLEWSPWTLEQILCHDFGVEPLDLCSS